MKRVLVVGSSPKSGGGISSVIRLIRRMPVWEQYGCYWLGTQIQGTSWQKLKCAMAAYVKALFIIWRYDIVHFHTVPILKGPDMQFPVFLLARLARKHIIMHIHVGNQLSYHTGNRLFKYCLNHADQAVFLAQRWEKLFLEQYTDVHVPTAVVYNACDTVPPVPYDSHRQPYILFAGSIDENKALDLLLKAFAPISTQFPAWKIVVLGTGDIERYSALARELGIDQHVAFMGYIEGEEKRRFFSEASLYCMCSYVEGFPMVVLEAWTYGIPVITTPVGGLPDVLEEGRNAVSFPFGDHQALSQALTDLILHPERRVSMSAYGRQFVESHFSLPIVNESLERLYR